MTYAIWHDPLPPSTGIVPRKIAIAVPSFIPESFTHPRRYLAERSFASLAASGIPSDATLIVRDDGSEAQYAVLEAVFNAGFSCKIEVTRAPLREGVDIANKRVLERSLQIGADFIVRLDDDFIYARNWLMRAMQAFVAAERKGIKLGYVSLWDPSVGGRETPHHETFSIHDGFAIKPHCSGGQVYRVEPLRMIWDRIEWKDNEWDWSIARLLQDEDYVCAAIRPSVIKHIGLGVQGISMFSAPDNTRDFTGDDALDFIGEDADACDPSTWPQSSKDMLASSEAKIGERHEKVIAAG